MTIANSSTAKTEVTQASLFDIARNVETTLVHLNILIESSAGRLAELSRRHSVNEILDETEVAQTLLDAAGLYIRNLESSLEALYKQAWALPNSDDA